VFGRQTKFQSENLMADVYLGIMIAGVNTLIVLERLSHSWSYERPLQLAAPSHPDRVIKQFTKRAAKILGFPPGFVEVAPFGAIIGTINMLSELGDGLQ
jgi:hypothetical protein